MKKIITLCLVALVMTVTSLAAQAPAWEWAEQAGGSLTDFGEAISLDSDGNSYVTGYFLETATFGTITLTSSGIGSDIFVAKMDKDGNWLWATQAGGTNVSLAFAIAVDSDGNSYITGYFEGSVTFGATTLFSPIGRDSYVAKLDTDGNWLWAQQIAGTRHDCGEGISVDSDGNAYTIGEFSMTVTFGSTTLTSLGAQDIYIAKIDPDGNWLWAKSAGGNDYDASWDVCTDSNGNSYITGPLMGTEFFGSHTLVAAGSPDIYVAKLDTDGNWQWAQRAGGTLHDVGFGVAVDREGNSYVTGLYYSNPAIFGADSLYSTDLGDVFVAKMDADGNWLWAQAAHGTNFDCGYDIAVNSYGESYITGEFFESLSFDSFTLTSGGNSDIFVAKLSRDGDWRWAVQALGTSVESGEFDIGRSIAVDSDGNSYTTGDFYGTVYFGPYTLMSNDYMDIFVSKLPNYPIGDFNDDGYVNAGDLQLFGNHWRETRTDQDWDPLYDLDHNGIIDAADLQIFGDHWHEGIPTDLAKSAGSKGPNTGAGIEFDLDATTAGNQNLTHIGPQPAGTMIRVDVYATGVHNLDTYEFNVVYDPAVLEYKGCAATNPLTFEENILTKNGGTAIGWMVENNDTTGVLNIAYTLADTDTAQAPEGEGLIADIVFQAKVTTYGMLSFSDVYYYDTFGVKDAITNTGTATLPVELSAFTATYNTENDYTSLSWTTASETDIQGYNVYRSTEDAFDTSKQLNAAMIEGHGTTTEMNTYEFVDVDQLNFGTTYYYWLESIEYGGMSTVYTSIKLTPEEGNGGFVYDFLVNSLSNYPNPFRNSTTISYSIKGMLKSEPVQISIYNMLGQLVDTVEGKYGTATWNTKDHATGIYFYKLNTDSYTEIKKMMVTK